jgi:hypothetical protein
VVALVVKEKKMIYAQALEKIAGLDGGEELLTAIKAEVNDKGKENKSLRDRLKAFGDKEPATIASIIEALEAMDIDMSSDIKEQLSSFEKKAGEKVSDVYTKQLKALQKTVETLQTTLATEQTEKQRLASDNKKKTIESQLSGVFGKNVLNPSTALKYHIGSGDFDLDETGNLIYKNHAGENVQVVNGNIDSFLKDYPEAARNTQSGGAGSVPKDKRENGEPLKFTIEQVKAMSAEDVAKNYDAVKQTMAEQKNI